MARMNTRILLKGDTAANWTTAGQNGFIPMAREPIYYTDTYQLKVGDGVTRVHELPFITGLGDGDSIGLPDPSDTTQEYILKYIPGTGWTPVAISIYNGEVV